VSFEFRREEGPEVRRRVVEAVRAVPHRFRDFKAA
jgi:hypothetical protein